MIVDVHSEPKTQEELEVKRSILFAQITEIQNQGSRKIFVTCYCGKRVNIHFAYKCFYCGLWFCGECGQIHFGDGMKT